MSRRIVPEVPEISSVEQASLALLRSLFDGAPDAILIVDQNGSIVLANAAVTTLFGYTVAELIGTSVERLVPEALRERHVVERVRFAGGAEKRVMGAGLQLTALRKDGTLVPVEISLTTVHLAEGSFVIAIARDVTVHRRFLDACPIAIFVSENARVTYANAAALRLVGAADQRALQRVPLVDFVHPDDRAALESWLAAIASALEPLRSGVEERVVRFDGSVRYVLSTSVVVPNAPEHVCLTAMQDVTERRQAAEHTRKLEFTLQQQQRLADIGAVTSRVVHDIANPIAGLIMAAQRALQLLDRLSAEMTAPVRQNLVRALDVAKHLQTLLQEFKDFSREQRIDAQRIALAPFLDEVKAAWVGEAVDRGIQLNVQCPASVEVRADKLKLRRVFDNLVKNALEAIERGPGEVHLVASTPDPDTIRITIADSGPGFPDTLNPFTLFETTKPTGTGLGLLSVKQIVTAHGGRVELESRHGPGAVFRVDLPVRATAALLVRS